MKIYINNNEFTKDEMDAFTRKRLAIGAKLMHFKLPEGSLYEQRKAFSDYKLSLNYEEMLHVLGFKLKLASVANELMNKLSRKSKWCFCTICDDSGISAKEMYEKILEVNINREKSEEYRRINNFVTPDHYVQANSGEKSIDIIECTGNLNMPVHFEITFDDPSGLTMDADPVYPYQWYGTARSKRGTVEGGVRHQFRDTENGFELKLGVQFPSLCPKALLDDHSKHLALEQSNWIEACKKLIKK